MKNCVSDSKSLEERYGRKKTQKRMLIKLIYSVKATKV
jgi:hypothetical protein